MKTIDFSRDYVTVGGRLPLFFMQDGYGFNRAGECLGRFNAQGEPLADEPAVELPSGDGGKAPKSPPRRGRKPKPRDGDDGEEPSIEVETP